MLRRHCTARDEPSGCIASPCVATADWFLNPNYRTGLFGGCIFSSKNHCERDVAIRKRQNLHGFGDQCP